MFIVEKFLPSEWKTVAMDAHLAVFNEALPVDDQKIDFALLSINAETNKAVGYMTCREVDIDSVYMKHGGAFEPFRNGVTSYGAYTALLTYLKNRYKNINTLVANSNSVYLRMALGAGLKIVGIRNFRGLVLVELFLEGD